MIEINSTVLTASGEIAIVGDIAGASVRVDYPGSPGVQSGWADAASLTVLTPFTVAGVDEGGNIISTVQPATDAVHALALVGAAYGHHLAAGASWMLVGDDECQLRMFERIPVGGWTPKLRGALAVDDIADRCACIDCVSHIVRYR